MYETAKLFILGQPGSGKSTIARDIVKALGKSGLRSTRINDYAILKQMFDDDTRGKQFRTAGLDGFDVIDFTVIDIALTRLEQSAQSLISYQPEQVILIEFARNDYQKALQQFSSTFLQDAYFLYLHAEIEQCKQRIRNRVAHPTCVDDYYVSEYILDTYYNHDQEKCLSHILIDEYGIDEQRVKGIDNNSSIEEALSIIYPFVGTMIGPKFTNQNTIAQSEDSKKQSLLPSNALKSSW
jgi:adenylate kinase family enzyme